MKVGGVLERILVRTREHVQARRREVPLDRAVAHAPTPSGHRSFEAALSRPGVNVIAEFKRRSPSRGILREDLVPAHVAQAYEVGGAAALSVLTEEKFFGGSLEDLKEARNATLLPTLRKDFLVDPYQVWESRLVGADAVLLIVATLGDADLRTLWTAVQEAGLEALFEVHDREDLDRALRLEPHIVGVNNRDLRTLEVDLGASFDLIDRIPEGVVAVAESGLKGPGDVRRLRDAGFDAFLVGEHLMLSDDMVGALETLIKDAGAPRRRSSRTRGTTIKVCGITSVEDGRAAVAAGADAIGLVFWEGSPRRVEVERAREIAAALPPFVTRVGVFVDAPAERLREVSDTVGLDLVQLHGDEDEAAVRAAPRRVIKAVRVGPGFDGREAVRFAESGASVLLDTRSDAAPGGTGRTFDWASAAALRDRVAYLVLAGGLTPRNVAEAIRAVRPDAVDVSSGVESAPGRKDPERMRAFVEAVRGAKR
jgi:indole-3-glycerol phosphate synthase/phosphoribosylanthranilate isomerase